MTRKERERADRKVIFFVAGGLLAGAAGIALLAGLSAQHDAESERLARVARSSSPAMPASHRPAIRRTELVEPPAPLELPLESNDLVDPDADAVVEGTSAWHARDYSRAATYFAVAAEQQPDNGWLHYMQGLSTWKNGEPDQAIVALERAAQVNPASIKTWVNLSRVLNDVSRHDDALVAVQRALEVDAADAGARFVLARTLFNQGRLADAAGALGAAIEVDDSNGYAYNLLGLIRIQTGESADAEVALRRAVELAPDVAFVRNNLGVALEQLGRLDEALVAFRRAAELDSTHERALISVARLEPLVPESVVTPEETTMVALAESTEITGP